MHERNRKRGTVPRKRGNMQPQKKKKEKQPPERLQVPAKLKQLKTNPVMPPEKDKLWQSYNLLQLTVTIEPLRMGLIKQEKEQQQEMSDNTSRNSDAEEEWQQNLNSYIVRGGCFTNTPAKKDRRTAEVPLADRKAFICSKCGFQFSQRFRLEGHLKWHERMIMNSILYTCEKCGVHYKQLSRLKSHIASVHVLKRVLKQGTRGRNRVGHIFRPQLNEENRRRCKETREVTAQDCGDGQQTDEETDLHHTVEENDRCCSSRDRKYDHKCTNKQTDRRYKYRRNSIKREVDQYSDEENNQRREHQRTNENDQQYDHQYEETVNQHIDRERTIKYEGHECANKGNEKNGESKVEIGLKSDEEYDQNHEETGDEENDQTCQEGVDYVIEENDQSDEDYQQIDEDMDQNENDPCFNEEIGDDGESLHRFKSTDRRCRKRKDKTTTSFEAEINPQRIERRSKRHSDLQNTRRRSLRLSSNTHVDQMRHPGDSQQRKDGADRQGNRQGGRQKRKREGRSSETNVKKGCRQSGNFACAKVYQRCLRILTCSECGRKFMLPSHLRKHLLTHQQMSTAEVFHCRICRRQCTSLLDLQKHMFEDHDVLPPSKDENADGQIMPSRLIEKFHVCDICGLKMTRPSHLRNHKLTHKNSTVDKNLVTLLSCEICGLEYSNQGCLKRHMRFHAALENSRLAAIDKLFSKREGDEERVHHRIVPLHNDLERDCNGQEKLESEVQQKSSLGEEDGQQQNGQQNGKDGRKAEGDNGRILPSNDAFVNEVTRSATDDIQTHAGEIPYDICSKDGTAESYSDKLKVLHAGLKTFKCRICANAFKSLDGLQNHSVVHSKEKPISKPFDICSRDVTAESPGDKLEVLHAGLEPFKCRMCANAFTSLDSLQNHWVVHSKEKPISEPFECKICHETFSAVLSLGVHFKLHLNLFICKVCQKPFNAPSQLKLHEASHSTEQNKFSCCECDKSLSTPSSLKNHVLLHKVRGLRHKCRAPEGGCAFLKFKNIIKTFQGHVCKVCKKAYRAKCQLRQHMLIHTGEKPYECSLCGAGFRDPRNLAYHTRSHTGVKPYGPCEVCGKWFARYGNLYQHRSLHTGEKPFKCDVCFKVFRLQQQLRSHQQTHQKDKSPVCKKKRQRKRRRRLKKRALEANEEDEKELFNGADDIPSIVEQYDYATDDEQELSSPKSGAKTQKTCQQVERNTKKYEECKEVHAPVENDSHAPVKNDSHASVEYDSHAPVDGDSHALMEDDSQSIIEQYDSDTDDNGNDSEKEVKSSQCASELKRRQRLQRLNSYIEQFVQVEDVTC